MREVTAVWFLYLLFISVIPGNAGQPCPSSGTLSWAITQNCTLDTAGLKIPANPDVAILSLEGSATGELATVLLSGPPLSGVLSAHHQLSPEA
jgi:hypothetical protein